MLGNLVEQGKIRSAPFSFPAGEDLQGNEKKREIILQSPAGRA